MSRKSEREFVGEGISDEEFAALNGDGGSNQVEHSPEPDVVAQAADPSPQAADPAGAAQIAPQGEPEQKMVDVRALQEARAAERTAREELARIKAEEAEKMARLDERIKLINEALQPKPAEPKVPTMEEEPLDHIQHRFGTVDGRFKTVEERLEAFERAQEEQRKQSEAAARDQALITETDVVLTAAGAKHADVNDAFEYAANGLRQAIMRHVSGQGFSGQAALEQGEKILRNETLRLARQCPRDPDQAAEFIRANARYYGWGYQQPQQPQQQAQPAAQQPVQPQVQQPTIQQRADQQQRHMSLSGVTGAEPPKMPTAKELADMPQDKYNDLLKTVAGKKMLEEQFGGY